MLRCLPCLGANSLVDMEGAKFSIINNMRTGRALYDALIAMLVPVMFKVLFDGGTSLQPFFEQLYNHLLKLIKRPPPDTFVRTIEVEQMRRPDGRVYSPGDERSSVLLRALKLYVAKQQIAYTKASMALIDIYEDVEEESDSDEDDPDRRTEIGTLKKWYRVTQQLPEDSWIEVDKDVSVCLEESEDVPADKFSKDVTAWKVTTTMQVKANSEKRVIDFINEAYDWYLEEQLKMQKGSRSRHMYEMLTDGNGEQQFRRYKLADEKTFQSMFFPQKDLLLQVLDHFKRRTGKYAISGYPHKLGLLLYGPPGTGKTSLIKVLANHTGRSIVNVPLARIKTNTELMQLIFDQKYKTEGTDAPVRLRIKDVIFVMEDVDAVGDVVHRRDGKEKPQDLQALENRQKLMHLKRLANMIKIQDEENKGSPKESETQKEDAKSENSNGEGQENGDEKTKTTQVDTNVLKQMLQTIKFGKAGPFSIGIETSEDPGSDTLNLAGILNVLDGVVDTPGRMLVMTSNHPEMLDPALIRPGRIDKQICLTYMVGDQAAKMIAHYFQTELAPTQVQDICRTIDGSETAEALEITPARLEQLCAEHEDLNTLHGALKALVTSTVTTAKPPLSRTASVNAEASLARQGRRLTWSHSAAHHTDSSDKADVRRW